jgi:hypothetical protein
VKLYVAFTLGSVIDPEDVGDKFLRDITGLYSVRFEKAELFIATDVRKSDPT